MDLQVLVVKVLINFSLSSVIVLIAQGIYLVALLESVEAFTFLHLIFTEGESIVSWRLKGIMLLRLLMHIVVYLRIRKRK